MPDEPSQSYCSFCGNETTSEAVRDDNVVCEPCNDEFVICEDCRIETNDGRMIGPSTLCPKCASEYRTCEDCEDWVHSDNDYYCDPCGRSLCSHCHGEYHDHDDDNDGNIHDYGYKPIPVFHGTSAPNRGTRRYYGLELEIDGAGCDAGNADSILEWSQDESLYYIKSDSSLNCGLEIVTHPATLPFHLKHMPWGRIVDRARALEYKSHNTKTCGLHIHVSTAAFGVGNGANTATSKLVALFWRLWPELVKFSRRDEDQIYDWCRRNYDGYGLNYRELNHAKKKGRYMALNFSGPDTIEVRLFRGTLKLEAIYASIELIDVLVDFALTRGFGWVNRVKWSDVVDASQNRKYLERYLEVRNLGRR